MVITIKDIERREFERWRMSCKKEVASQIILDHLKKKKMVNRKQAKEIQERITKLGKKNLEYVKKS